MPDRASLLFYEMLQQLGPPAQGGHLHGSDQRCRWSGLVALIDAAVEIQAHCDHLQTGASACRECEMPERGLAALRRDGAAGTPAQLVTYTTVISAGGRA